MLLRASARSFDIVCGLPHGCLTDIPGIPVRMFAEKHKLLLSRDICTYIRTYVLTHTHTHTRTHTHTHTHTYTVHYLSGILTIGFYVAPPSPLHATPPPHSPSPPTHTQESSTVELKCLESQEHCVSTTTRVTKCCHTSYCNTDLLGECRH